MGEDVRLGENRNHAAWDYALGIIKVDGLEPSKEFLELVEKEKNGQITTDEIRRLLDQKYRAKKGL